MRFLFAVMLFGLFVPIIGSADDQIIDDAKLIAAISQKTAFQYWDDVRVALLDARSRSYAQKGEGWMSWLESSKILDELCGDRMPIWGQMAISLSFQRPDEKNPRVLAGIRSVLHRLGASNRSVFDGVDAAGATTEEMALVKWFVGNMREMGITGPDIIDSLADIIAKRHVTGDVKQLFLRWYPSLGERAGMNDDELRRILALPPSEIGLKDVLLVSESRPSQSLGRDILYELVRRPLCDDDGSLNSNGELALSIASQKGFEDIHFDKELVAAFESRLLKAVGQESALLSWLLLLGDDAQLVKDVLKRHSSELLSGFRALPANIREGISKGTILQYPRWAVPQLVPCYECARWARAPQGFGISSIDERIDNLFLERVVTESIKWRSSVDRRSALESGAWRTKKNNPPEYEGYIDCFVIPALSGLDSPFPFEPLAKAPVYAGRLLGLYHNAETIDGLAAVVAGLEGDVLTASLEQFVKSMVLLKRRPTSDAVNRSIVDALRRVKPSAEDDFHHYRAIYLGLYGQASSEKSAPTMADEPAGKLEFWSMGLNAALAVGDKRAIDTMTAGALGGNDDGAGEFRRWILARIIGQDMAFPRMSYRKIGRARDLSALSWALSYWSSRFASSFEDLSDPLVFRGMICSADEERDVVKRQLPNQDRISFIGALDLIAWMQEGTKP